ncbi:hypothetical protein ILYODFUR_025497, partial [Ilyodon furcidens]
DADVSIKQCPVCGVYIERNQGCAQMLCKSCKHTFCWYCLQNLDGDIFLRHYDKGPCRNKLGHSRASVMWNRTQQCVQQILHQTSSSASSETNHKNPALQKAHTVNKTIPAGCPTFFVSASKSVWHADILSCL